ncbi:MAG: phosphoribosyltransferase [Candidatus Methylacidiphilales bacterium]|nr:phosphoribosyltransferase family protein [Candidatus Methylacidiphilales bacterium]
MTTDSVAATSTGYVCSRPVVTERTAPGRTLFTSEEIAKRVRELGDEIYRSTEAVATKADPIILLGLMNGAMMFLTDLLRSMPATAHMEIHCQNLSSYKGTSSTGTIRGLEALPDIFTGRYVIIVDDILDTGFTLHNMRDRLLNVGARQVDICVLLDKKVPRTYQISPQWIGFEIPNLFVIGYGLDLDGAFRSLPDIRVIEE